MPPNVEPLATRVDGTPVRGTLHGKGESAVVLVHGLLADSRELGALPEALAKRGLSALAIDLRGHGQSDGPRGVVSRERALEDLLAWKYQLSQEGRRLRAVFGHSLGSCWAIAAARMMDLEAIATACALSSVRAEVGLAEYVGYRIGEKVHSLASRLGKEDLWVPYKVGPKDTLTDPKAVERMEAEGVIMRRVPLAIVEPLLRVDAAAWAREVTVPALFGVATEDRVVSRENTQRVFDAYAGPKTWADLPGGHSCFYDAHGRECAGIVADWMADVLLEA